MLVLRSLIWALKEVDPVRPIRQSGMHAQEIGIINKYYAILGQTCKQKFWQDDGPPLANGALCLSTPKYNGNSGTGDTKHRA